MENKEIKSSVFNRIKSNKKITYILIAILTVFLCFFLLINFNETSKKASSNDSVSEYVNNLEIKLEKLLKSVEGAGNVKVAIRVDSGMETVLAMKTTISENSTKKETVEQPIIVNGKTVVIKELYPKITGVLIVAEGGNSISVMKKIQQATVSLLNVNVNQIEILAMK